MRRLLGGGAYFFKCVAVRRLLEGGAYKRAALIREDTVFVFFVFLIIFLEKASIRTAHMERKSCCYLYLFLGIS